jgi:hypothetical protein
MIVLLMRSFVGLCCIASVLGCQKDAVEVYQVSKARVENQAALVSSVDNDSALKWHAQPQWVVVPVPPPLLAKFSIPVSTRTCELTISQLSGDAGGLLANVNRWRGQLGLPPVDGRELASLVVSETFGRYAFRMVGLSREDRAMSVAILELDGTSWFFKLSGRPDDVSALRGQFVRFLTELEPRR